MCQSLGSKFSSISKIRRSLRFDKEVFDFPFVRIKSCRLPGSVAQTLAVYRALVLTELLLYRDYFNSNTIEVSVRVTFGSDWIIL